MKDKGLTLVEVLLALFILSIAVVVFSSCYYAIHRLMIVDTMNQQMAELAKAKVEELKSNRIYINNTEYPISEWAENNISFNEGKYKVEISIQPLHNESPISHVHVKVGSEVRDSSYNLIRYINFSEEVIPSIYEELTIDSNQFNY